MIGQLRILLRYDFYALRQAGQQLASIAAFALLSAVLASFVFRRIGMGELERLAITPGMLLMLFSFTGLLVLRVMAQLDSEGQLLLGLVLGGVDPWSLFLAKLVRTVVVVILANLLIVVFVGAFFGVDLMSLDHFPPTPAVFDFGINLFHLLGVTLLYSIGLSSVGTLLGLVAQVSRLGELLLPLMLFPLLIPLIVCAYEMLNSMFIARLSEAGQWYLLMLMFDFLAILLSAVLFEFSVKE